MIAIKTLFDPSKDIYRTIEKVITYNASQETRLRAEIAEYVVTDSIEEQFEKLLTKMQAAMELGPDAQNEVGVWVSGFYGSGKSSFTKYLGLALDQGVQVDGVRFLKHLQDRMHRPQTKALLAAVAARYPAAVVMLDLASEQLAGASMVDVSSVLYYKVLQWAGYSRNLKVAALERRLKKDGRYDEFTARIEGELKVPWREVQNDPLVIDSLLPDIAHQMYPELFKTPTAFVTETADFVQFENERVKEMLDIVREASGKQYVLFIIDEVGQYVAPRPQLILNLDGLGKNLKAIGGGKAWIIGTAQQTLTEDDPRAALNSRDLYKLAARFPIQIDLESSDIKEICTKRLLGKSPDGERALGDLFDRHGQALRFNTRLQDARFYDADFDRATFTNLYPFLPAHFDILLHLLGALAKSTGGIGLRSAIKVIQDILIEGPDGKTPVADCPVGWLATSVTLYDVLEKDVRRAAPSIHKAVGKALLRFPDSPVHREVAKTVAVLQILGNMPVTAQNVAALMHPAVDAPSQRESVDKAIQELIADPIVPFGEKEGNLTFFSEKLNDIDQERAQITLRTIETRRIQNEALRDAFDPLPAARLQGTLTVTSGLKAAAGSQQASLAGEREAIQTVVELADPKNYETARTRLLEESRQRRAQYTVFLLGRDTPEIAERAAEIFRCREIASRYRNDPDQEVKDYCTSKVDRANTLTTELRRLLKRCLGQGSFLFRGQTTAVETLDQDVLEEAKKHLSGVAEQAFDRYVEAPVRVETALAEKFLRTGNLKAITSALDPLGLVKISGGIPRVQADHKALVSIHDYVDRNGSQDGKRLIDHFSDAPFGWSPDTLRYLVAALLVAGQIKFKVAGREVTVNGQQAIEALKTNNSFKGVGVSLRDAPVPPEVLARAAERLTDLAGELVIPLEDEISRAAAKHLPEYQHRIAPLAFKLESLGLLGADIVRALSRAITDLLASDASDAPEQFGSEQSELYAGLKWASAVDTSLKNGLEGTVRELQLHRREIAELPDSGIPGRLRADLAEQLELVGQRLAHETFYKSAADLNTALTAIKARARAAAVEMEAAQQGSVTAAQAELERLAEWDELTQEEQAGELARLDALAMLAPHDLAGLRQLLRQEYVISSRSGEFQQQIEKLGRIRRLERLAEEKANLSGGAKLVRSIRVPAAITAPAQLSALIRQLQNLQGELAAASDIEITIQIES